MVSLYLLDSSLKNDDIRLVRKGCGHPICMTLFDATEAPVKAKRYDVLAQGRVVFDSDRCVQCGVCSYNCPVGIDVRAFARTGQPVSDSRCLSCGQCVVRCPRGVPRFAKTNLFG